MPTVSFLTPAQLANRWNIMPKTLSQWRWNGRGPHYSKVGGRVAYALCDIEAFETRNRRHSTSELQGTPVWRENQHSTDQFAAKMREI